MININSLLLLVAAAVLSLALPPTAGAHQMSVFAYREQGRLQVESYFGGQRPAQGCAVTLLARADSRQLGQGETDSAGKATLAWPDYPGDMLVTVNCGQGHQAQWPLEAGEKGGETEIPPAALSAPLSANGEDLRPIVAQEVERQLAPLRRQLAAQSIRQPGLADALAGVGYIVGLAGLFAWWRGRRKGD
ncbi:MAG: hypothetical protein ABFR97_00255 [Thermodesulfobacteriota bacterium]